MCHRLGNPNGAEAKDHLYCLVHDQGQLVKFLLGESTQHEVNLSSFWEVVTDSHAKPRIVLAASEFFNVFQPVVPGRAAFDPHPEFGKWNGDIVHKYQDVLF